MYQAALRSARDAGWAAGESSALGNLYAHTGRFDLAVDHLRQALSIERAQGDTAAETRDLNNLGIAFAQMGRFDRAVEHLRGALELTRRHRMTPSEART